jgi:hypothetical protein
MLKQIRQQEDDEQTLKIVGKQSPQHMVTVPVDGPQGQQKAEIEAY